MDIPKCLNILPSQTQILHSYTRILQFMQNECERREGLVILLTASFQLNSSERRAMESLAVAFDLNKVLKHLRLSRLSINDISLAEVMRAALRNNTLTSFVFEEMEIDKASIEIMCRGLEERSTRTELSFRSCSKVFVEAVIEASVRTCFHLSVPGVQELGMQPLKKMISRGSLCYLRLTQITRLNDAVAMALSRCIALLPKLVVLDLEKTRLPTSTLKCLFLSLQKNLELKVSSIFSQLGLGPGNLEEYLLYCFIRLLRTDQIKDFCVIPTRDALSSVVVKHISSTVAKTKNLASLRFNQYFVSGTSFTAFKLQEDEHFTFFAPFNVNP